MRSQPVGTLAWIMLLAPPPTFAPAPSFTGLTGPRFDTPAGLPADARRAVERLADDGHARHAARGLPRVPFFVRATLTFGVAQTVYTRDVNAWSVGLVGTAPLPVGAKVTVRLLSPDGYPLTATARVRRCQPIDGAWFDTHAEFCTPQYPFENV